MNIDIRQDYGETGILGPSLCLCLFTYIYLVARPSRGDHHLQYPPSRVLLNPGR